MVVLDHQSWKTVIPKYVLLNAYIAMMPATHWFLIMLLAGRSQSNDAQVLNHLFYIWSHCNFTPFTNNLLLIIEIPWKHCNDVTWISCSLKSPVIQLFVQWFMWTHIKETSLLPLVRRFIGYQWICPQMTSNMEKLPCDDIIMINCAAFWEPSIILLQILLAHDKRIQTVWLFSMFFL